MVKDVLTSTCGVMMCKGMADERLSVWLARHQNQRLPDTVTAPYHELRLSGACPCHCSAVILTWAYLYSFVSISCHWLRPVTVNTSSDYFISSTEFSVYEKCSDTCHHFAIGRHKLHL